MKNLMLVAAALAALVMVTATPDKALAQSPSWSSPLRNKMRELSPERPGQEGAGRFAAAQDDAGGDLRRAIKGSSSSNAGRFGRR